MLALSELALFKPTMKLDMETQAIWAENLANYYPIKFVLMAIEQLKHSAVQWVNFGEIATEARRLMVASGEKYAPHADPKRLTTSQLSMAVEDKHSSALERQKVLELRKLKRLEQS